MVIQNRQFIDANDNAAFRGGGDHAALIQRVELHAKMIDVMTTGQHQLASQIAELTIGMQDIRRETPELVAQGIAKAMGSPATWAAMREGMQREAQQAAGSWVMGLLWSGVKKMALSAVVLWLMYQAGGLPLLLAFLKIKVS